MREERRNEVKKENERMEEREEEERSEMFCLLQTYIDWRIEKGQVRGTPEGGSLHLGEAGSR